MRCSIARPPSPTVSSRSCISSAPPPGRALPWVANRLPGAWEAVGRPERGPLACVGAQTFTIALSGEALALKRDGCGSSPMLLRSSPLDSLAMSNPILDLLDAATEARINNPQLRPSVLSALRLAHGAGLLRSGRLMTLRHDGEIREIIAHGETSQSEEADS